MAAANEKPLAPSGLWEDLQARLDDDSKIRDQIRDIVLELEKAEKTALSTLTNTRTAFSPPVLRDVETRLLPAVLVHLSSLAQLASQHPYYKYNHMWSRQMQDVVFASVYCGWLGGFGKSEGTLLTIEEVGQFLKIPVNVKDRDTFHLTIEEYLHGLISLIDELARLARNSVTQGNYSRPVLISDFVKDLHAGFQLLNLKNDALRRRSDSIKYKVREIEDVVYDLSLRNLLPKSTEETEMT